MTDTNHVVLVGRLTKDLGTDERSFGYVQSGQARANISIAVNRSKKSGDEWVDEVNYFDVTIWGKTAENLKPYLTKGKQIVVDGYLKQDRWEKDGQKFSRVSVVANTVQLMGGNEQKGFNPQQPYSSANQAVQADRSAYAKEYEQQQNELGLQEDIPYQDDIPF